MTLPVDLSDLTPDQQMRVNAVRMRWSVMGYDDYPAMKVAHLRAEDWGEPEIRRVALENGYEPHLRAEAAIQHVAEGRE